MKKIPIRMKFVLAAAIGIGFCGKDCASAVEGITTATIAAARTNFIRNGILLICCFLEAGDRPRFLSGRGVSTA